MKINEGIPNHHHLLLEFYSQVMSRPQVKFKYSLIVKIFHVSCSSRIICHFITVHTQVHNIILGLRIFQLNDQHI